MPRPSVVNVAHTITKTADIVKAVDAMVSKRVMVGVPAETALRRPEYLIGAAHKSAPESHVNNAFLAYIHENGAPEAHIPARPFLRPAVESMRMEILERMYKISRAALAGHVERVEAGLSALGLRAQATVRNKITDGPFLPLADSTLRARAARGRKGAKQELARRAGGLAAGTDLARPLIDTGQLRMSINYVIRRVKGIL